MYLPFVEKLMFHYALLGIHKANFFLVVSLFKLPYIALNIFVTL